MESGFFNLKQASKDIALAPLFYNNNWFIGVIENNLDKIDMTFDSHQQ
jgi:hypothetical protein